MWIESPGERSRPCPCGCGPVRLWCERMRHVLRPHPFVELLRRQEAQLERGLAQGEVLTVRLKRDSRRLLVADVRVERRHQHERAVKVLADALLVWLDASGATVVERAGGVGQQPDRLQH